MTASTVLWKPLMTTQACTSRSQRGQHWAFEDPGQGSCLVQKPDLLPTLKVRLPSGSATCSTCPKDALSWAPSEPHEESLSESFYLGSWQVGRCHPAAVLKRWERIGKAAFQREILSASCSRSLESYLVQASGSTEGLWQVVRASPRPGPGGTALSNLLAHTARTDLSFCKENTTNSPRVL